MYFFIEKSKTLQSRAEQFELSFQDIYVNAMQEMQAEYSLPSLHEWGDGYVQGDATEIEIDELKKNLNISDDVYEYLDRKLMQKLESQIEAQIIEFGENEYSSSKFDEYKEKAEEVIRELLEKEYYQSGGTVGHDYSVFFLADEMKAFEHVEASSNWMFEKGNDARFRIAHLSNFEKAFKDFSDFVSESRYTDIRSNFSNEESEIVDYLKQNCQFDEEDFFNDESDPHPLEDIKTLYKSLSFEEEIEMWESLDNQDIIETFNDAARSEAIDSIIEAIQWDEIESWFDGQFEKEEA